MPSPSAPLDSVRMALYGGSFDPVHNAHLGLASHSLSYLNMDRVVFIPSAQSPLKPHPSIASPEARLEMLHLAIASESRFSVDLCEIEKDGVSYTIDTVQHFQKKFPSAELYWILGADQFERLSEWHRINELVRQVRFLVFARSGNEGTVPAIPDLCFQRVEASLRPESSTCLRARCAGGQTICGQVPEAVEAFILSNRLYGNN